MDDTLIKILSVSSRVATSLDLDLAFGAVDVNDDLVCTSLLSPLSHLPPPMSLLLLLLLLGSPSKIQDFSLSNLKNNSFLTVSWVTGWVASHKYSIFECFLGHRPIPQGGTDLPRRWGGGTDPTPLRFLYGSFRNPFTVPGTVKGSGL